MLRRWFRTLCTYFTDPVSRRVKSIERWKSRKGRWVFISLQTEALSLSGYTWLPPRSIIAKLSPRCSRVRHLRIRWASSVVLMLSWVGFIIMAGCMILVGMVKQQARKFWDWFWLRQLVGLTIFCVSAIAEQD